MARRNQTAVHPANPQARKLRKENKVAKFRKKPVVIEAIRYKGDDNFNLVRDFVGNSRPLHRLGDQVLGIDTLEGVMNAHPGDWIIKGVKGEFYPCKPDIFEATYDLVKDPHLKDAASKFRYE